MSYKTQFIISLLFIVRYQYIFLFFITKIS